MKNRFEIALFVALGFGFAQSGWAQLSASPILKNLVPAPFSNSKEDELIEPDLAFKLKISIKGPNTLLAELSPAQGYYLYKDRIRFALKDTTGVTIGTVKLPAGEMKTDQIYGRAEVYRKPIVAEVMLIRPSKTAKVTLLAAYQGCQEKLGVCYPPIDKTFNLTLP